MLHLVVLAMIDLWDMDPDAAKPPPPSIGQKLSGTGDVSDGLLDPSAALGPSPLNTCTYGAPALGSQLWSDASGLMRTFTTPSCDDGTSAFASSFAAAPLFALLPFGWGFPSTPGYPSLPVVAAPEGHTWSSHLPTTRFLGSGDLLRSLKLPADVRQAPVATVHERPEARLSPKRRSP